MTRLLGHNPCIWVSTTPNRPILGRTSAFSHSTIQRHARRSIKTRAIIDPDLPSLPSLAAAALLSSTLTATWFKKQWPFKNDLFNDSAKETANTDDTDSSSSNNSSSFVLEEPRTAQDIWNQAWAAFEEPSSVLGADTNSNTSPSDGDRDDIAKNPLLWLQGIKSTERTRLLSLSLEALQQHINSLPMPLIATANQHQLEHIVENALNTSTMISASAWLGYHPQQLINLRDRWQAAANNNSSGIRDTSTSRIIGEDGISEMTPWYGFTERVALYCSVLRLLQCRIIEQVPNSTASYLEQDEAASYEKKKESSAAVIDATKRQEESSLRNNALSRNRLLSSSISNNKGIQGWRALDAPPPQQPTTLLQHTTTTPGVSSQLLRLAPWVLQDMAVLIADSVAAGYLTDVATGMSPETLTRNSSSTLVFSSEGSAAAAEGVVLNNNVSSRQQTVVVVEENSTALVSTKTREEDKQNVEQIIGRGTPIESSLWPTFTHPALNSTRRLQRFANMITTHRWLDRNFKSIAAIVEDRLPLFTLLKGGGGVTSSSRNVKLRVLQAPMRRSGELKNLKGFRLAVSLALEAIDFVTPFLYVLWAKATAAVSFLLVNVLGNALGLVYKGIQNGLTEKKDFFVNNVNKTTKKQKKGGMNTPRESAPDGQSNIPGFAM